MMAIFSICVFFSATVPLVSVATAFFCLVRHWLDCLNLLNVNRKEIDSQGALIDIATNTALIIIVCYQICMMAFFSMKDLNDEASVCTVIFLISILYIVFGYVHVNAAQSHEEEKEQFEKLQEDPERLQTIINNWR